MGNSTYYSGGCCAGGNNSGGSGTNPPGTNPPVSGDLQSSSHEYFDAQSINLATLLAQSSFGNAEIHEVDIDVRDTQSGVQLVRGGGSDMLLAGGTRKWSGAITVDNEYRPANDFVLTMTAGDNVVISWSEIV